MQHVFLVPGFFGFANLGELVYFAHVKRLLEEILEDRGVEARVTQVHTHPTASIRTRAARLLETVRETVGPDEGPVHLVGHSTGGLDARLLVSPAASLGTNVDAEPWATRVRTVVTVATPHRGTPLASFFGSLLGAQLLQLLSLSTVYALRYGGLPMRVMIQLGRVLGRFEDPFGLTTTTIGALYEQLLADFTGDRREAVTRFFTEVGADQSLVTQLSPEAMDAFNAGVTDRPGVRYGSVITCAAEPGGSTRLRAGLNAYAQVTHTLYGILYGRAARLPESSLGGFTAAQLEPVRAALGRVARLSDNDGIVPTLSQPWGETICAAQADHLDVIGHFDGRRLDPPHVDWLCSGTGFRNPGFEAVWERVADFLLAPYPPP